MVFRLLIFAVIITLLSSATCEPIRKRYVLVPAGSNAVVDDTLAIFDQHRLGLVLHVRQLHFYRRTLVNEMELGFANYSNDTVYFPQGSPITVYSTVDLVDSATARRLLTGMNWKPLPPHQKEEQSFHYRSRTFRGIYGRYKRRLRGEQMTFVLTYAIGRSPWRCDTVRLRPSPPPSPGRSAPPQTDPRR